MPSLGKRLRRHSVTGKQHVARKAFDDNKEQAKDDDVTGNESNITHSF